MAMDNKDQNNFIIHTMNTGFSRAADSFSKLVGKPVRIKNSQSVIIKNVKRFSYVSDEEGDLLILVTKLIGDISGESYLIFNQEESEEIAYALYGGNKTSTELLEAFLLEVDNIISASVISDLSNALKIELYGDVPELIRIHSNQLEAFMNSEIGKHNPSCIIFSNTTFYFDSHDRVHPQFVWKLSSKIFDLVPLVNA